MSNVSRGKRQKQQQAWAAEKAAKMQEKEAKRQAGLKSLKDAVLAPLGPKKTGELPPELRSEEEL